MRSSRRAGFTVASLLLLTAIVAVYAAAIMTARDMDPAPQPEELAAFAIAGFFFGTVTGFFLGLFCGNRNRDMIFGVVEGGLFGPPTFVLLVIPDSLPVVLVGGMVLVGFAVAVRLLAPRTAHDHEADDPG